MRIPDWLATIRCVIYDLDGTLYADTHHFDYYAAALGAALLGGVAAAFQADWQRARRGQHVLRVGCLYDAAQDLILALDGEQVTGARRWDGTELPAAVAQRYPQPPAVDHVALLNVGDLWWLPAAIAAHHGLPAPERRQAFLATRSFMSRPEFRLSSIPGLAQAMQWQRRQGIRQVLATNSPEPDSRILTEKAGLAGVLDGWFFEVGKPAGMAGVVAAVCEELSISPAAVLSVGDNYLNDITPAAVLGCRTALLDPEGAQPTALCDLRLGSMAEYVALVHGAGNGAPGQRHS